MTLSNSGSSSTLSFSAAMNEGFAPSTKIHPTLKKIVDTVSAMCEKGYDEMEKQVMQRSKQMEKGEY